MQKKLGDILTDEDKWCQRAFDWGGKCCLIGAVNRNYNTANGTPINKRRTRLRVLQRLAEIIRKLHPKRKNRDNSCLIMGFNDSPSTDFKDIKEVVECYDTHFTPSGNKRRKTNDKEVG
jgi:hypothetical protein